MACFGSTSASLFHKWAEPGQEPIKRSCRVMLCFISRYEGLTFVDGFCDIKSVFCDFECHNKIVVWVFCDFFANLR